jgi:hypothetical protein
MKKFKVFKATIVCAISTTETDSSKVLTILEILNKKGDDTLFDFKESFRKVAFEFAFFCQELHINLESSIVNESLYEKFAETRDSYTL